MFLLFDDGKEQLFWFEALSFRHHDNDNWEMTKATRELWKFSPNVTKASLHPLTPEHTFDCNRGVRLEENAALLSTNLWHEIYQDVWPSKEWVLFTIRNKEMIAKTKEKHIEWTSFPLCRVAFFLCFFLELQETERRRLGKHSFIFFMLSETENTKFSTYIECVCSRTVQSIHPPWNLILQFLSLYINLQDRKRAISGYLLVCLSPSLLEIRRTNNSPMIELSHLGKQREELLNGHDRYSLPTGRTSTDTCTRWRFFENHIYLPNNLNMCIM